MSKSLPEIDWSTTPLGAFGDWPPALRLATRLCNRTAHPMSVWAGPELRVVFNRQYAEVFGAEAQSWTQAMPASTLWPDIQERMGGDFQTVMRDHASVYRENQLFSVDREGGRQDAYFTFSLTPIEDDSGVVVGYLNVVTETTAVMQLQQDLRRMFDLSPGLLAVANTSGRYIRVNPAFTRVLGWSREELLDKPGSFFVHPDDRDRTIEQLSLLSVSRDSLRFENRYLHQDGTYRWLFWTAASIPEEGLIYAAGHDITQAKTAEAALRASEERFRELAEAVPQLVWVARPSGKVWYYNSRAALFRGLHPADGEWDWTPVIHPEDRPATLAAWRRSVAEGHSYEIEHRLQMTDGSYRWHLSRAQRGTLADGSEQWFGTATDIDEVKRAQEALLDSDRRKDEYLAMLGHELRNPLAAVRNAVELIKLANDDPPVLDKATGVLERQITQMSRLIDGLLEVSRIARGKIHLDRKPLDLVALIERFVGDRSSLTSNHGLELVVDLQDEPVWVVADPARLTQILDNLLGNAVKFTPSPGTITIRLRATEARAVLTLADTGIGMRSEVLTAIFEPFRQETQDVARSSGGLGLGLALCKGLVELHDGVISASSEGLGRGTAITVELPLAELAPSLTEPSTSGDIPPRTILLVEDNADAALMLADLLTLRGHQVAIAESGRAALETLRDQAFDLALCDIGLPDISGYELARIIRSDERLDDLDLIALSGYGQPDDRRQSAEAGFRAHLTKPIDLEALEGYLRDSAA